MMPLTKATSYMNVLVEQPSKPVPIRSQVTRRVSEAQMMVAAASLEVLTERLQSTKGVDFSVAHHQAVSGTCNYIINAQCLGADFYQ